MSLIFKALQRFGNPESTHDKDPEASAPKRNTFTWRKVLLSPPIALGGAAAIFLAGLVVSQGINFLPPRVKYTTPIAEAAHPGDSAAPDAGESVTTAAEPVSEAVLSEPPPADVSPQVSYQVYSPEKENDVAVNTSAGPEPVQFRYLESIDAEREGGDSPKSGVSPPIHTALPDTKNNQVEATSSSVKQTRSSSSSADDDQTRMYSLVRYDKDSPAVSSKMESIVAKPSFSASANQRQSANPNPDHQRQAAQATKHLQVSQLANRISSAIQADDVQQSSALLAKLAKMVGAENAFVLKLKAYSFIRQNRLDEAHALLSDVLAHNAMDREAGLNMAVIDMKSGRLESARRRLVELQELYPEDSHISIYLRQLPR